MARPVKCRRVCQFPQTREFIPAQNAQGKQPVIMTVDEYEAIRLIDREGLSQEQCSERMQIARTTAQKIYENARKKLADALVDGLPLKIEGGEYRLCAGECQLRSCGGCHKQRLHQFSQKPKEKNELRIAVPCENGQIFQHFGHAEQLKVFRVENAAVVSSELIHTDAGGHAALAELLCALRIDALICDRIGGGAQNALACAGIRLYAGVSGDVDAAVAALLENKLDGDPNARFSPREEGQDEDCGRHSCGERD